MLAFVPIITGPAPTGSPDGTSLLAGGVFFGLLVVAIVAFGVWSWLQGRP